MKKLKGDIIELTGEVYDFRAQGCGGQVDVASVQDFESNVCLDEILLNHTERKVKVTVEFLD